MFSYLICGQVKSRLKTDPEVFFQKLRNDLSDKEIIVSTWPNEVSRKAYKYIDKVIVNKDPGESHHGRNWPRILIATSAAISAASMPYIIRSRIEVRIAQPYLFQKFLLQNLIQFESKIFFPYRVSAYQFSKGLLFAWPDFFQIASKQLILRYWDSAANPNIRAPFHMTTGANNSLSSDQVLGANFAHKNHPIDYFEDKYHFSITNWKFHFEIQQKYISFFDEARCGLDFGRLARNFSTDRSYFIKMPISKPNRIWRSIYRLSRFIKIQKRAYFLNRK